MLHNASLALSFSVSIVLSLCAVLDRNVLLKCLPHTSCLFFVFYLLSHGMNIILWITLRHVLSTLLILSSLVVSVAFVGLPIKGS